MSIPFSGKSHCWHCGNQLMWVEVKKRVKGERFYFSVYVDPKDPMKHEHRVHKDCLEAVKNGEIGQ
ncbi:MAG: hypothetical protein ACTS5I_17655 [Rhodanobacter sp.]